MERDEFDDLLDKLKGLNIYKNENLENVVDWFIAHYNQYRKVLN